MEPVDEFVGVGVRIVPGHVEQRLRDRQWGPQLVRGVGGESLLLGDLGLEPREHGVEGVGELAELIVAAFQLDPVGERSVRGQSCRIGDASQGREHPAGEEPASQEAEHQQERQDGRSPRGEGALEVGSAGSAERGSITSGT